MVLLKTLPRSAAFALALGLLGLSLAGCSSSSTTTDPGTLPDAFPTHSADQIRELIQTPSDTIQTFSADARMRIRSPEENRSFNANVRHRRADSLFMRFSLFGVEGARILLTPDSAFVYDSRKNSLRAGPLSEAEALFPAPLRSNEVFENMLGIVAPDPDVEWRVEADGSLYYLEDPSGRRRWTVDPTRWRVVRYERENAEGTIIETRRFSDFQSVGGVLVPHQVMFHRPQDDLLARINYETIHLNPSDLSFDLGVPRDQPRKPIVGR